MPPEDADSDTTPEVGIESPDRSAKKKKPYEEYVEPEKRKSLGKDSAQGTSGRGASDSSRTLDIALDTLRLDSPTKIYRAWLTLIGVSALLDYVATVVAELVPEEEQEVEVHKGLIFHRRHKDITDIVDVDENPWIIDVVRWLDKWSIAFGAAFSILWFVDAFVKAKGHRDQKLRAADKKHVLEGTKSVDKKDIRSAWATYYKTILFQSLLLPVGFYLVIFTYIRDGTAPREILEDDEDIEIELPDFGNKQKGDPQIFVTHTSHCVLFALLRYGGSVLSLLTGVHLKASVMAFGRRQGRRLAFFAIRNPKKFAKRLRKFLAALRWLKYLAPLIGASNKLRGNVGDLLKKRRQRKEAKAAMTFRKQLWTKQKASIPPEELERLAAIKIQSTFRAQYARRAAVAVRLIKCKKEELAALKMQKILRTRLARARARLVAKKQELLKLQAMQKGRDKSKMSWDDRKRMYELQDELGTEAKELLNHKLLLRPNTTFAVTWKILFVICVLFEIAQLALAPKLEKYVDKETHSRKDIGSIMREVLVPEPMSEWEECRPYLLEEEVATAEEKLKGNKVVRFIKKKIPKLSNIDATVRPLEELRPWYCKPHFATAQNIYIQLLKTLLADFLIFVGVVCFLDVFVTFFTGEFDENNGNLIPKPFFTRWILPGIVLQMLVNPQMETVSKWVFRSVRNMLHFGPVRCYRWMAALFFPLFRVVVRAVIANWLSVVKKENKHVLAVDPFEKKPKAESGDSSLSGTEVRRQSMLAFKSQGI